MNELKKLVEKLTIEKEISDKKTGRFKMFSKSIIKTVFDFWARRLNYGIFGAIIIVFLIMWLISFFYRSVFYFLLIEAFLKLTIYKYYQNKVERENQVLELNLHKTKKIYTFFFEDKENIEHKAVYFYELSLNNTDSDDIQYAKQHREQIATVIELVISASAENNIELLDSCYKELNDLSKLLNLEIDAIKKKINNKNIRYISEMTINIDKACIADNEYMSNYLVTNKSVYVQITNIEMNREKIYNYFEKQSAMYIFDRLKYTPNVADFNLVYEDEFLLTEEQRKSFITSYKDYLTYYANIVKDKLGIEAEINAMSYKELLDRSQSQEALELKKLEMEKNEERHREIVRFSNKKHNELLNAQTELISSITNSTANITSKLKTLEDNVFNELQDTKDEIEKTRKNNDEDILRRGGELYHYS